MTDYFRSIKENTPPPITPFIPNRPHSHSAAPAARGEHARANDGRLSGRARGGGGDELVVGREMNGAVHVRESGELASRFHDERHHAAGGFHEMIGVELLGVHVPEPGIADALGAVDHSK